MFENLLLLRYLERGGLSHRLFAILEESESELDPATREFLITGHGIQLAASSASAEAVLGANVAADPAAQLVPAGRSKRRR